MIVYLPKYIPVWYENNPQTGYYTKSSSQPRKEPFKTLPFWLRVETTKTDKIKERATQIIRGREKNKQGKYAFLCGLAPIPGTNHFVSNYYRFVNGFKKNELVIFCFSQDNSRLWVYYFPGFDKNSLNERIRFAANVLPQLLADGIGE